MRFAMMLGKLGRDMSQWYPNLPDSSLRNVSGAYVRAFADMPKPISYCINSAFDPIAHKIALIRGLDSVCQLPAHNHSIPTTGSSHPPSSGQGFGYSIDAVLEESLKFYPTPPVIGALRTTPYVGYSNESFSYTSKITRGQLLGGETNPQIVYNKLLNPNSIKILNDRNGRIRSSTDLVLENFRAIMNGRSISSEDKPRLDSYMTYISEIHAQMAVPSISCGQASDPGNPSLPSALHKAMIRMEVAALACGTTKIAMHGIMHSGDVADSRWHEYAHGGESTVNPITGRYYLSEYSKFSMDLVAYFLTELDKIQESNGTLLDNTFFIYGNEDGTGSHEHVDLPVLVAGDKGKLLTGYFIDYRSRPLASLTGYIKQRQGLYAGRPYNNLLVTAFKSLGLNPDDYQKFGELGFGRHDSPFGVIPHIYDQYLGTKVNDALPFLYIG
jgi:hypothetical protein